MKIEDRGFVYDAGQRASAESVASFTGLCPLASGRMLCTFQLGSAKHAVDSTVRLCRSADRGRTWQELAVRLQTTVNGVAGSLGSGEMVEVEPGRILLMVTWFDRSDPRQPLFDPVTEGLLPSKQLAAYSSDEGDTWTPWREVEIPSLKGCTITGPMLRWSDGAIAYAFESYKDFRDRGPATHGAWYIVSRDRGATFGSPVLVAQDPRAGIFYWDQRMCVGPAPGEYVSMFWTHDLKRKQDLPVHLCNGSSVGPVATAIPGQIAAPLLLENGDLLSFVVDRGKPGTMTLWRSPDRGLNWPESCVVHVHDERALLSQGKENIEYTEYWDDMLKWSFGHPALRSLGDGRVLVVFYAGVPGRLSIHWARVDVNAPKS